MLNDAETRLLNANLQGFPMITAASASLKRCGKCGHGKVDVRVMLRAAAAKYRNDPTFIAALRSITPLPCMIGGVLIK